MCSAVRRRMFETGIDCALGDAAGAGAASGAAGAGAGADGVGAEGDGLTARTVAAADVTVRIPMTGAVDSLNVAAAAAVAMWSLRIRG